MTQKLVLNFILIALLIFVSIGIGYSIDSGTGKIVSPSNILWHYFPDLDAQNPEQDINVLVMSNSGEDTAAQDLEANTTGINFASLNVYDYDPQPEDFDGYDAVLLFEDGIFDNTVDVGNAVYNYQQNGGGVLLATFVWQDWSNNTKYGPRLGWGSLESMSPLISDTQGCEYNADDMGAVLIPDHPIMNGVNSLYADSFRGGTQLSTVGTALALWSTQNYLGTDDPVVAVYEPGTSGRVAAISTIPHYGYFGGFGGDYYQLFENTLKWVAAAGTTVSGINGNVTDLEENPIADAIVIVISAETRERYRVVTDASGYYEVTDLAPGNYWIICIKRGYKIGLANVGVAPGETTTQDFELVPR